MVYLRRVYEHGDLGRLSTLWTEVSDDRAPEIHAYQNIYPRRTLHIVTSATLRSKSKPFSLRFDHEQRPVDDVDAPWARHGTKASLE